MKIKSNAFSGAIMKQFNGLAIGPINNDNGEQIAGVSEGTALYGLVEGAQVLKTKGLFLHKSQVEE